MLGDLVHGIGIDRGLDWSRNCGPIPRVMGFSSKERVPTPSPAVERASSPTAKCFPRLIALSSRRARALVSLSCESALPCSGKGRVCVCRCFSRVSWRSVTTLRCLRGGKRRVVQRRACFLCFWRALGQSAQDTPILYSSKEPAG